MNHHGIEMAELTILVRSHHFVIRDITVRARPALQSFAKRFIQYKVERFPGGNYARVAKCTYGAATANWREWRFHINQLPEFMACLKHHYLDGDLVDIQYSEIPKGVDVDLPIFEKWKPRDYQLPVIEFMVSKPPPPYPENAHSKLVSIQTGKGKSYSSMEAMRKVGKRVGIIIKPMYIEKWIEDVTKTFDVDPEDFIVVRGSSQLMALMALAESNELSAKIIIISNKTFQNYIKMYELHHLHLKELGYAFYPDEFFEKMGIGYRLIDEVHLDFHLNFKIDLYTNVEVSVSLSATLTSNDPFMESMYAIAYPQTVRYVGQAYHKYVNAKALIYGFKNPKNIRFKDGTGRNYSHHAFEQSIIRQPHVLVNYLKLIKSSLEYDYMRKRQKNQKCLIFCASIDLCTIVTKHLQQQYPNLDVRRYVEDDPYENIIEADIIVSTMQSAGTALDIPDLITVIMTTAMSSKAGNIQGFGRLREIPGVTLHFIYYACEQIEKQMVYHEEKKQLLRDLALTYKADYHTEPV